MKRAMRISRRRPDGVVIWRLTYRNAAGKVREFVFGHESFESGAFVDLVRSKGSLNSPYNLQHSLEHCRGAAEPITKAHARQIATGLRELVRMKFDLVAEYGARHQGKELRQRVAERDLVRTVMAEWFKRDQADNKSRPVTEAIMAREVLPLWGNRDIGTITKRDVRELVEGMVDRGVPVMANRVHAYLRRMFKWAAGRDIIEINPAASVEKPTREVSRDRVLADDELAAVWRAASGRPGAAIKLLILTAARRDEVFGLRWSEVDLDGAAIRLPAERNKGGAAKVVTLSPAAVELLRELPRQGTYVFGLGGKTALGNASGLKRQLDAASGVTGWRLHDLRRTVATGLQRLGVRLEVTETVLGHISGSRSGVVGIYQRHAFTDEARAALIRWSERIAQLVDVEPAKVVKLRA